MDCETAIAATTFVVGYKINNSYNSTGTFNPTANIYLYIYIYDSRIFYEKTKAHLDNGAPAEKNPTRRPKSKKNAVNVRGKHVLYWYKTENPPSQPATYTMLD